ncbi:MAG TPA: alpha/beta hydrolase [Acidimicrobiia bacterium]|nr:alpha/beta hydrolase [Acidimicrobiia bacterium]
MLVESSGVRLDVQVEGEGVPVVLLHGFPDSKRLWSKQVPVLVDAGFRVIVPDQRGYGESDKPTEIDAYAIPFLAIDVTAVLDALGIERAHVVGHDWGAAVAWATASFAPERVDHLVALSVGHPSGFFAGGMTQREKSWYMLLFQYPDIAENWLRGNDWAGLREWGHHPDHDAVVAELERSGALTPGLNWYRANITPEGFVGPPLELPPVQSPAMGVWSSGDFALTEEQMAGSAKFCTGEFRYERVEGPGHWMQWEAPDAVNALLLDFLPR